MPKNKSWCEERKEMEKHMKCLKEQVDDALAKQHEAMTRAVKLAQRNQELMKELKAVDRLALCVEEECNSTLKDSADKISKAQAELDDNICKLQKMDAKVNALIKENQMLKRKNCELVQKRKEAKEAFLEALQEKDRMLVELRNDEEELCQKMEKMSQTLENQKQRIMCLEAEVEERQGHQKKVTPQTKGNKICKGKSQQKSPKCRGHPNRANCRKDANNSECTCCLFDDNNSKDHSSSRGSHSRIIKIHSESPLSHLTLQLVGRNAEDECEDSKSSCEEELMDDDSDDFCQISEEEIDANMKENTCQGDYAHSRSSPPYRLASPEVVMARLKRERDIAQCDVERLQAEILSLRKRLEAATDVQMQEKCLYEKSLAKEEEKIRKLQLECDNLYKYQSSLCSKVQGQEESISKLMECLEAVKGELGKEQCLNKYLKKKVDEKTEDLNNLGLECRRQKNEVDQLQKCSSQQREKNVYPIPCSSSRSKRISPIEEEGDTCGKVEGCAHNGPSLQREGRNVGMMERKAHKCKTPPELSKRPENCPQQMQHESRHTHTTIKASSASPRMKCKNDCVHSVRKLIVHSMDKRASGESGKHPERSKCSPRESEAGAKDKGSPGRKSTSPGPKIHVHANITSGGFVNVELQDEDESGGEYCSHHSTRV